MAKNTVNKITQEQAEGFMIDKLHKLDMGDKVYEFAQGLFHSFIDEIDFEHGHVVDNNGDEYESDEAWYDDIREDFFQEVYDLLTDFLTKK